MKTKTIKATIFKGPKVKITKVKPVKNKSFDAATVEFKEEDLNATIAKEIVKMKKDKDELVLLEAELEKPFADRNKALMKKYGYVDGNSKIDAYPNLVTDQKYKMSIYSPEDTTVPRERRPNPWYVKVDIKHDGNEYIFRFPMSRTNVSEEQTVYQLDGYPVFLDTDGNIIDSMSEYTIFQALVDFNQKIIANKDLILLTFGQYGISDSKGDPWTIPLDFCVRGKNFGVSYHRIKSDSTIKPKITTTTTAPPPQTNSKYNLDGFSYDISGYTCREDASQLSASVVKRVNRDDKQILLGLDSTEKLKKKNVILENVIVNDTYSTAPNLFMLTSYDSATDKVGLTILNGVTSLSKVHSGVKKSPKSVEEYIKKANRMVFDAFQAKNVDIDDLTWED